MVLFDPSNSISGIADHLWPLMPKLYTQVKNLGVVFNSALKCDRHINTVMKGCLFQLQNIAKSFLSFNDLKIVTYALISSHLDYCNAIYLGISQSSLSRLQLVDY